MIDSWDTNPVDVGPIYPGVGWEWAMFAACLVFCVAFMVWKFRTENANYAARVRELQDPDMLANALAMHSPSGDRTNHHDEQEHLDGKP
jgi:hypothetical protein